MNEYRWNAEEMASGYDVAAEHIHPYYTEIQTRILDLLDPWEEGCLLVDAGGGSGRFVEKFLARHPASRAVLVDQSESFLQLARIRLQRFGERATCQQARLQDDWFRMLDQPSAIVSMSAIHHLEPSEKRHFYEQAFSTIAPGGCFINGDEVRAANDAAYLAQCKAWASRMHDAMDQGLVPESMFAGLLAWEKRNVSEFNKPRTSGDDCHETIDTQCGYLRDAGFASVTVPWQKELWAIFIAAKAAAA